VKIVRGVTVILGALAVLSVASLALSALLWHRISPLSVPASAASLQDATPAPSAALQISKRIASSANGDLAGNGVVRPGAVISYTIDFTNTGQITATGVYIVDDYAETLVSDMLSISDGGGVDAGKIVWDLGSLLAGEAGSVSYAAILSEAFPPGSSNVENTAAIGTDAGLQARGASWVVVEQPDLTAIQVRELVNDLDEDEAIDPGDTIKYVIEYKNTGRADATGVTIVHDYDEGFIVEVASIDHGGEEENGTITWDLGTVPADHSDSVSYEARLRADFPPGRANIEDRVTIDCDELGPAAVPGSAIVKRPILTLLKKGELAQDVDEDGEIGPGDVVRYTIEYQNTGDADATEVTIVDNYDRAHMTGIRVIEEPGRDDGYTISWDLGTVKVAEGGSVSYMGMLGNFPVGSTDVRNRATIVSAELPPVSKEFSTTVRVVATPTPEPTPVPSVEGPTAGIFAAKPETLILLLFVTGLGGVVGLIYAGVHIELAEGRGNERLLVILEGIAVHLIICAVIVLALGGGIKSEAAAAILSAVAGYVFGRARSRGQG
jgi:uncharacterized repeat protein (TIGR01451 family)